MGIKNNILYQGTYQILIYIVPLIVSPYLSRTLGANNLGNYTYIYSIAYYFIVLGMLGIQNYGCRCIAQSRNNKKELSSVFSEIFICHLISSGIACLLYCLFVIIFIDSDRIIYVCCSLSVVASIIDFTWFFSGIENFRVIVIRNAFIKITNMILVFTLVKSSADILEYILIESGSMLVCNFLTIPALLKYIEFRLPDFRNILSHFKPLLVLSLSVISISIYASFDKTLLGLLDSKESVAFYEYSEKIVKAPVQLIAVVGTVLLPRAAYCFKEGRYDEIKLNIKRNLLWVFMAGSGFIFGFLALGDEFSILYYGEEFLKCGKAIMYLSPLVLIITIGHVFRSQYLIPFSLDGKYVTSLIICAISNFILNLLLIPLYGLVGAILATIIAESIGCTLQIYFSKKFISPLYLLELYPFLLFGLFMYLIVKASGMLFYGNISGIIIKSFVGIIVYTFMCFVYLRFSNKIKLISSIN